MTLAQLGLAYFGLAWLGSRPEAGPSTALLGVLMGMAKKKKKTWIQIMRKKM
jgi:hypothetical protein